MGPAALPGRARQGRRDGGLEARVGVGDDQRHPGQAPGDQAPQERHPAGAVLGGDHVHAEDLAVPVGVDAGGDGAGDVDDAAPLADLLGQRVDPHVGVGPGVEGPVAERVDHLVEARGHLRDLGLGDPLDAHGLDQAVHPAGRHARHVALGHHRHQRLLGPAAGLEQPVREVAARAQLGDGQLDRAGPGVEAAGRGSRCGSSPAPG